MKTKVEKLENVYEYLRSKGIFHTKKEFANEIQFDYSNLTSAFNGSEKHLTDGLFKKICTKYSDLNEDYFLCNGDADIEPEMIKNVVSQNLKNATSSIAIGRDANGSEIHVTSKNVDDFIQITEKYQEQTDRLLAIIEKLINK
jgi:hypothetical protein